MHGKLNIGIDRRRFLRTYALGVSALSLAGCESVPQGQPKKPVAVSELPRITRLGAIDVHAHVVFGNPDLKPGSPETDRLMTGVPAVTAARVREEMSSADVGHLFCMGHRDGTGHDPLGIESTLRVADLVPGMMVIGIANPFETGRGYLRAVEEQINRERNRLVALKAYLGYVHMAPDDPGYVPYFLLAEKYGLPFVFHTGDTWSVKARLQFAHPLGIDAVAVKYPKVRFVIAHFGNPWLMDAAEVVFKNDNVWADLSGLCVADEELLAGIIKNGLPEVVPGGVVVTDLKKALAYANRFDRILYGTDWPLAPMATYRRFIEAVISKEHHEKVFRSNAEQLFLRPL